MPIARGRHRQRCGARRRVVHRRRTRRQRCTEGAGAGTRHGRTTARVARPSQPRKPLVRNVDVDSSAGRSFSTCQRGDRIGEVVAVAVQPLQPRQLPAAHVEHRVEAGQHSFVGRQPRIVRIVDEARIDALIGVAEQRGRVAGPAGGVSDVVEAGVERRAVGDDPVVHLVRARVQRGAARRARCRLRVVPGEANTLARQVVEGRCPHHGMAGARQAVGTELIERDRARCSVGAGWSRPIHGRIRG